MLGESWLKDIVAVFPFLVVGLEIFKEVTRCIFKNFCMSTTQLCYVA